MQITVRGRSDLLDGALVGRFLGTPGQTKVEDSDRTVRMLFFSEGILVC